ncbi:MAG: IS982 family transposase, partial [Dolichospermum sp.]
ELAQEVIEPLRLFFHLCRCTVSQEVSFIDSLPLPVCHNRRINKHRVFADCAGRSKSSMGWYYGFKLHAIITPQGEFVSCTLSSANIPDSNPDIVQELSQSGTLRQRVYGLLVGDRGYLSTPLTASLAEHGIRLLTNIKKNMKPKLIAHKHHVLLKKRMLIECCFDLLANSMVIRHSRYRSMKSFIMTVFAGLIAYSYMTHKPSITV